MACLEYMGILIKETESYKSVNRANSLEAPSWPSQPTDWERLTGKYGSKQILMTDLTEIYFQKK